MAEDVKRKALIFLILALMLTYLIGVGLPRLKFQPGMPLPSFENGQLMLAPGETEPPVAVSINIFAEIIFIIIATVILLRLLYRFIRGVNWKKLLSDVFRSALLLLVLGGIIFLVLSLLPKSLTPVAEVPLPVPSALVRAPLGPVPPLLIWLVGIGLFRSAMLLGIWLLRWRRPAVQELWELEAAEARQALLAGEDFKNVILGCYQRMSLALQQEQAIERDATMTTGEFERLLAAKGVPHEPVHQLTQLFEAVRYGLWQADTGAEQRALQCLDAILVYSRDARQGN